MKHDIFISTVRRHALYENKVVFVGGVLEGRPESNVIELYGDNRKLDAEVIIRENRSIWNKYNIPGRTVTSELHIIASLEEIEKYNKITVKDGDPGQTQKVISYHINTLKKQLKESVYNLDSVLYAKNDKTLTIRGWALNFDSLEVCLSGQAGNRVEQTVDYYIRKDIVVTFEELRERDMSKQTLGFLCKAEGVTGEQLTLRIVVDGKETEIPIDPIKDGGFDPTNPWHRMIRYYKNNGWRAFVHRAFDKVFKESKDADVQKQSYTQWMKYNDVTEQELAKQREVKFAKEYTFSIVVPLFNTPIHFLEAMISSVQKQTYDKWQLCLADGSDNDNLKNHFQNHYRDDDRICYKKLEKNGGISDNTNAAIAMATGDYIVLGDHDDMFAENALYELMQVITHKDNVEVIYSDEDKIDMKGETRFEPYFKSDFNIDLLCSNNYICHLFCVKKSLVDKIGGFRKEFDGAQDHDFILRCVEQANEVYHIPKILYHWRSHLNSTAGNPESKLYAFENGKKAVKEYFDRIGVEVEMEDGANLGLYHAKHIVQGNPMVSILIPNKDHIEDLDKCLASIDKNTYDNYEVIIIENNSTEEETFAYYDSIQEKHKNCKVVYWKAEFNYSKINNFGATYARGEYLLFLNNDIEAINPDWLERMLGFCQREDVGIVGAQLLYPDNTIQHAGVILGFGGIAGHTFIGLCEDETKAFGRAKVAQDYTAVTAACMMTSKAVFEEVDGFEERLCVAFNDIDFCMKVRSTGRLVVYNPMAKLYHYESKSRGMEDTPEKEQRFQNEVTIFQERWATELATGDPYYNRNLTLERADFSINA